LFTFSLDPPQHGWFPVVLGINGELHNFSASNVLNDPIAELAAGVLDLLKGRTSLVQIEWWLEPNWHSLVFEPSFDGRQLSVSLFCDHSWKLSTAKSTITTIAPTTDVCATIGHAFRDFSLQISEEEYEARGAWNNPYPGETIASILEIVDSRNVPKITRRRKRGGEPHD
jgi:hypothetical protein